MKALNVGLIGTGFMAKAHSLAYATIPMFFWPAPAVPVRKIIADPNEDLAREAAARYGYEAATGDWRQVVADPAIDIVDIAASYDIGPEIAIAAATAGKHVISERPLARSVDEAQTILDAIEEAGVAHMIAFDYRRIPAVTLAQKLIAEGTIGEILTFRGSYLDGWSADPDPWSSWPLPRPTDGDPGLGDIGANALDLVGCLMGEVRAVSAMSKTFAPDHLAQPEEVAVPAGECRAVGVKTLADLDQGLTMLLRFGNNAVGSLEAIRNGYGRHNYVAFELHGTKGSLSFDHERRDELQVYCADGQAVHRGHRTIYTGQTHPYGDGLWPNPALGTGYGETKIAECYDFVKAVVEGTVPSPNFHDGYRIALIADAILQSQQSQGWVEIPS